MNKKNIVICHPSLCFGGAEKVLLNMLNCIDYEKYDVDLFLLENSGDMMDQVPPEVHVEAVPELDSKSVIRSYINNRRYLKCVVYFVVKVFVKIIRKFFSNSDYIGDALSFSVSPKLSKKNYDIAIVYQGLSMLSLCIANWMLHAKKRTVWIHGDFREFGSKKLLTYYEKFDKMFFVSDASRKTFSECCPKFEYKTETFYNIIDVEEIVRKSEKKIELPYQGYLIVTVGRITKEKGIQMIPETAKLLLESGINFTWIVIGDGDYRSVVEQEIERCHVENRVILLGSNDNPYPYMRSATVYVQPSFTEGYCTTTCEAKVLCKPVITTNTPGMMEQFVNRENGLIVDEMTPKSIFDGIYMLLHDENLRTHFSERLKESVTDNIAEMEKLYQLID